MSADLTAGLLEVSEQLAPIFDMADGMRADLQRRGWSPTASEQAALAWLQAALTATWRARS